MGKEKVPGLAVTLKGPAFAKALETGIISEKEDGKLDTEQFEKFWNAFSTELEIVDNWRKWSKEDKRQLVYNIIVSIMASALTCIVLWLLR